MGTIRCSQPKMYLLAGMMLGTLITSVAGAQVPYLDRNGGSSGSSSSGGWSDWVKPFIPKPPSRGWRWSPPVHHNHRRPSRGYYYPQPTTQSYYTSPSYAPVQQNTAPPPKKNTAPKTNTAEKTPAKVPANSARTASAELGPTQRDQEVENLQGDNGDQGEDLKDLIEDEAKQDAAGFKDPLDERAYLKELGKGNTEKAEQTAIDAFNDKDITQAQLDSLLGHVDAVEQLNRLVNEANDGKFGNTDLVGVVDLMVNGGYLNDDKSRHTAATAIAGLHTNSTLIDHLESTHVGNGVFPNGTATIIAVGGLGQGEMVTLGNGAVLVGTGNPQDGVVMGYGNAAQLGGMSVGIGDPIAGSQAKEVNQGVLLINGGESEVHYNVNGDPFSMQPGYRQALPGGATWTVEFDRGGSHGTTKYGLSEGTYKFTAAEGVWELYQHTFKATIDNSGNSSAFRYVLNNAQQTVAAGQVVEHEHGYPLVVRFDNGSGQEKKKQLQTGTYQVAVTPQGTLDLYDKENVDPPVSIADVLPPERPDVTDILDNPKTALRRMFHHDFTPNSSRNGRSAATNGGSLFGRR